MEPSLQVNSRLRVQPHGDQRIVWNMILFAASSWSNVNLHSLPMPGHDIPIVDAHVETYASSYRVSLILRILAP